MGGCIPESLQNCNSEAIRIIKSLPCSDSVHWENRSLPSGTTTQRFEIEDLKQNMVENMDETHSIVDMNNHRTLGIWGAQKLNYADVASGGDGFTMVLRLRGGVNAKLEDPFLIFKNRSRSHPMINLPDDIAGVSYRTHPRRWMNNITFQQWLRESRAIFQDSENRLRTLFLDNCSEHKDTEAVTEALEEISTVLESLSRNATGLCQLLDSFII